MNGNDDAGTSTPHSMLLQELCRLTREARDLDLGTRTCPTKHIRDVRRGEGLLAAFAHEHVGGSKPLLIDGALDRWPAWRDNGNDDRRWTPESLLRREGDTLVTLTVTPDGRADAVRPVAVLDGEQEEQEEHFVLPHEERVPLRSFLLPDGTLAQQQHGALPPNSVRYLSSQNGCLEAELPRLLPDLLDSDSDDEDHDDEANDDEAARLRRRAAGGPGWARDALSGGRPAEAVNIWIGCCRSETSIHRDPYENVFAVLRGSKTFTLLPPHEGFRLGLEPFPLARWGLPPSSSSEGGGDDDGGGQLVARPEVPRREVLWTALDPSSSSSSQEQRARYPLFFSSKDDDDGGSGRPRHHTRLPPPFEVTVHEGQMLYLPAFWWHHVRQRGPQGQEREGCCVSVNWWFEPRFGSAYALTRFAEKLAAKAGLLRPLEDDEDDEDEDDDEEEEA